MELRVVMRSGGVMEFWGGADGRGTIAVAKSRSFVVRIHGQVWKTVGPSVTGFD